VTNCLFDSAVLYRASGSDPVERDTAASIRDNAWRYMEGGTQPWQNSVSRLARLTLTLGSTECHCYLSMTYTTSGLHFVVFVQRLSAWRSCQDRFFSRFPENGSPFPRHDMAWHGMAWHSGIMSYPSKVCWSSDAARPRTAPDYLPFAAEICPRTGTER
jgi:hypothetical protein